VLVGRRRTATHVAASVCELLSITKSDLEGLLVANPSSARQLCRGVLRHFMRREYLRALATRLRMRCMPLDSAERAAMYLQLVWRRYCDRRAMESEPIYSLIVRDRSALFRSKTVTKLPGYLPSPPSTPTPPTSPQKQPNGARRSLLRSVNLSPATAEPQPRAAAAGGPHGASGSDEALFRSEVLAQLAEMHSLLRRHDAMLAQSQPEAGSEHVSPHMLPSGRGRLMTRRRSAQEQAPASTLVV